MAHKNVWLNKIHNLCHPKGGYSEQDMYFLYTMAAPNT